MSTSPQKPLSFRALVRAFKESWSGHDDKRRVNSIGYAAEDTLLSGLACMFYKSPSMLSFQERMSKKYHRNNLQTQFGVSKTPKDTQMRKIIGSIDSESLMPIFKEYLSRLQRSNHLKRFAFEGRYLLTFDGTQYYESKEISCPHCLETELKNGDTSYSHKVVQPIISHPDIPQVLPMMAEEICNHDGDNKQDCETNAAKRLLKKIRKAHPRLRFIHMGDALYANTPHIETIRQADDKFIFRVKEGSHRHLFSTFEQSEVNTHEVVIKSGNRLVHKWLKGVSLYKNSEIIVDVMRLFVVSNDKKTGKQKSQLIGTWATDLDVRQDNIESLVKAARARWKIENEGFNCLKNEGYNLTHNWGHTNGASFTFYLLTILAFYMHQILDMTDALFQYCRAKARAAYAFWEEVRVLFNRILYDSWEALLHDFLAGFKSADPP
jgi:hypothetical protein